ncbi:serine-rich and transmembrane domain-containing 2-like [Tachysurus ichikawai]
MIIWKSFIPPSSSSAPPPPPPARLLSTAHPACTSVSPAARAASTLPSLPLYVGLFVCLLLLVLALVFVTLYRMKHTVAPMPCYAARADTEAYAETEPTAQETADTRADTSITSYGVV